MIDRNIVNTLLDIKENYEMPPKLLEILQDKQRRTELFDNFVQYIDDFSIDVLRDYFQNEQGDRDALKQDYTPDCVCKLINELSKSDSGGYSRYLRRKRSTHNLKMECRTKQHILL